MSFLSKVDVIITCYNQEDSIGDAINSVVKGNRDCVNRVLVVDDGSRDNSLTKIQEIADQDSLVEVLRKENGGACEARNHGIKRATAEWIAFLDGDDVWIKGKLEAQLDSLAKLQNPVLSYTSLRRVYVDENKVVDSQPVDYTGDGKGHIERFVAKGGPVILSTVVARKADVEALDGFDPVANRGEDIDLWYRLFMRGDVSFVDQPFVSKYDRGESLGTFDLRRIKDHMFVTKRFCNENNLSKRSMYSRFCRVWRQGAINAIRTKDATLFARSVLSFGFFKILFIINS